MYVDLSMNDRDLLRETSYECSIGDQVNLTLTLINTSKVLMGRSFLLFEPQFHSQQQKTLLKDINHMMLHSGSLVVEIPSVRMLIINFN